MCGAVCTTGWGVALDIEFELLLLLLVRFAAAGVEVPGSGLLTSIELSVGGGGWVAADEAGSGNEAGDADLVFVLFLLLDRVRRSPDHVFS